MIQVTKRARFLGHILYQVVDGTVWNTTDGESAEAKYRKLRALGHNVRLMRLVFDPSEEEEEVDWLHPLEKDSDEDD